MAHEIAHLVVDHRTKGNYNRWFTEGVAQYVELELTGFRFRDPAGSLENNRYSLQQLSDNFDRLPNQSLAYRQSLAAVYYLVHRYGEDSLVEIMDLLAEGAALDQALQKVCRLNLPDFENKLNDWLDKNWSMFS
nr:peptidase MA family metallohydrolase [Desulforadius tongensis]